LFIFDIKSKKKSTNPINSIGNTKSHQFDSGGLKMLTGMRLDSYLRITHKAKMLICPLSSIWIN